MKKSISYNESIDILNKLNIQPTKIKKLFISDALEYILAQDIIAMNNSPEYPTSAMDGYAIKYEDQNKNKPIKIIDFNPAGTMVDSSVESDTCIKTFTGSLMPNGSDTLIPIENVTVENDTIIINEQVPCGFATRAIGENYKKGEVLIKKGSKVSFAEIGVCASLNVGEIEVFDKPTVAIASTGSEILDVGEEQTNPSQIRSSNHLTLEAIAKQNNANVLQLGVVKDDKQTILETIKNALESSDIVVTTGGVSVGDYDFVKDVIKDELKAEVLFQGVKVKPGQHIIVAQKDNKFIVGLPGFAYSSTVTFLLYVLPLIKKFQGIDFKHQTIKATLTCPLPKKQQKAIFTACNVINKDGRYYVNFDGKKQGSSAILTNMLGCETALVFQDENSNELKEEDEVNILILN